MSGSAACAASTVQVHLVLRHQRQQQFQRAFELFQMEGKLLRHQITAPADA